MERIVVISGRYRLRTERFRSVFVLVGGTVNWLSDS